MERYSSDKLRSLMPFPAVQAHKYTRGRLVLVVGSPTYPGAACLAADAGQRMGSGYTEVITEASIVAQVQAFRSSFVVRSTADWMQRGLVASKPGKPCAYVVGCGFDPQGTESIPLMCRLLKQAEASVLIDGGALAYLSHPKVHRLLKRRFVRDLPTILTPHEGEAAHLADAFGISSPNPETLARMLSLALGALVVLKGSTTWISDGEEIYAMEEGTSALAKAGTGDVLAGMIGSLLAQGMEAFDACVLATTLHARAARAAAEQLTDICVIPEDVIAYLPQAIKQFGFLSVEPEVFA